MTQKLNRALEIDQHIMESVNAQNSLKALKNRLDPSNPDEYDRALIKYAIKTIEAVADTMILDRGSKTIYISIRLLRTAAEHASQVLRLVNTSEKRR